MAMFDHAATNFNQSWNKVAWWEHVVVVALVVIASLYALPSFFPSQPALQLSASTNNARVDASLLRRLERLLVSRDIIIERSSIEKAGTDRPLGQLVFADSEDQLQARVIIAEALGHQYVSALNSVSSIPAWIRSLGGSSVNLGLDLQGGVHFLLQVDIQQAIFQRLDAVESETRTILRNNGLGFIDSQRIANLGDRPELINTLVVFFADPTKRDIALEFVEAQIGRFYDVDAIDYDFQGSSTATVAIELNSTHIRDIEDAAVGQNLVSLRNRVNELGVSEPLVQRQGRSRIVVELPGVQDTTQAKRVIGNTANLEFRLEALANAPSNETVQFRFRDDVSRRAKLERNIIVTGANVVDAQSGFDENGLPQVNIELDGEGGSAMGDITRRAVGRSMGAVYIEYKTRQKGGKDGEIQTERYLEKSLISLATIQSPFANRFRITGLSNQYESAELALLLRAGSLAAPVYFVEERTVGASLGEENIRKGAISILIGLLLVALFMVFFYKLCGLIAIIALCVNLLLVISVLSGLGATLTLPGIAGLVLNIGMVVDANVLIFSRIREELAKGFTPSFALQAGFTRALATIVDANLTTLIVALILFAIGTGPVRGFAITLSIGIIGSLVCAVFMVRYVLKLSFVHHTKLPKFVL